MLAKFFESMDISICMLQCRRSLSSLSTFTKIEPMVRSLTNRRFTHGHVAQMKFILPEVIEKIKDDLITINPSAVVNEGDVKSGSANIGLWNIFRKRLLDFFEAHPEVLTVLLPVYIVFG